MAVFEDGGIRKRRGGRGGGGGLCMPKLGQRSGGRGGSTPMTLLDRFREVVFRLIMLSAISKGTTSTAQHGDPARQGAGGGICRGCYYSQESYNSEALADCIEFIKKSSASSTDHGGRDSAASGADGVVDHLGGHAVVPVVYS
ncbi:hypothetical protein H6P81_018865 [Aristolochia fimbriata]|uniref:Uncharacterized protein n=1 Tax=Aristolochia fimbriata TaxID=158543 RepID=A0AAV7E5D2_ARIFI|nr:hypothetical protein H6P81_018865 [Aristolochia fimbriata]